MKSTLVCASAALSILSFAAQANATSTNVLQFSQGSAPSGSIVYTNTFGTSGTPSSSSITGVFSATGVDNDHPYSAYYEVANGYGSTNTAINATLVNFTGYTVGPVTYVSMFNLYYVNLAGWKGEIQAVDPVSGHYNLISFDYSSAATSGSDSYAGTMTWNAGTTTAGINISFSTPGSSSDYANIFKSDFLDFSNSNSSSQYYVSHAITISLSSSSTITANANGTVASFVADPSGQFSSDPQPPSKTP